MYRSVRLILSLLLLALLIPPMAVQAYKPICCGQSECYSCCELLSHVGRWLLHHELLQSMRQHAMRGL